MNADRFELLVESYLENRLSEAEGAELLAAVEADPALRRRMLEAVALAGLLAKAHGATDLTARVQAALRPKGDKDALVRSVISHLKPRHRNWRFRLLAAAAVAAAAVALVFLLPSPPPAEVAPTARTAFRDWAKRDEAVSRAVAFLKTATLPPTTHQGPMPADDLVVYALLRAGLKEDDAFVQSLLQKTYDAPLQRTYTVALHAMSLQLLGAHRHRERLAACAQFLVDNQAPSGSWGYGEASPGTPRVARTGSSAPNNSCAYFAALGLRACAESGIPIPRETLDRAAKWWRGGQRADLDVAFGRDRAGWCYDREETDHRPYGSMTAAGLTALSLLDRLLGLDPMKDEAVVKARRWLTHRFTVHENFGPVEDLMAKEMVSDTPGQMTEFFYYLWALGNAAGALGIDRYGGRDWFDEGARELLMLQEDRGSWYSGVKRCKREWDTCFAILFLTARNP
jgi:hypothetical protein